MSRIAPAHWGAVNRMALEEVTPSGTPVREFRLHDPSKPRNDTLITFTSEGIVIQGDVRPGENGIISESGLDLNWFCGSPEEDDLCSKFLHKEWQPDVAARDIRKLIHPDHTKPFWDILTALDAGEDVRELAAHVLLQQGFDTMITATLGFDYPTGDAGWLCAIQRRFAFLRTQVS